MCSSLNFNFGNVTADIFHFFFFKKPIFGKLKFHVWKLHFQNSSFSTFHLWFACEILWKMKYFVFSPYKSSEVISLFQRYNNVLWIIDGCKIVGRRTNVVTWWDILWRFFFRCFSRSLDDNVIWMRRVTRLAYLCVFIKNPHNSFLITWFKAQYLDDPKLKRKRLN